MAVAYDNAVSLGDFGVTTITTGSFTISGANRAAALGFAYYATVTGVSGSCGGQAAALVSGTQVNNGGVFTELWRVIAPATGSQTATMSWTNSTSMSLGVVTATGVDQTTPLTNGATNSVASGPDVAVTVTSTSGDLTVTVCNDSNSTSAKTSSQTKRTTDFGCMDTGAGTGNTTHTWTVGGAVTLTVSGANFVAVVTSLTPQPAVGSMLLTGQDARLGFTINLPDEL